MSTPKSIMLEQRTPKQLRLFVSMFRISGLPILFKKVPKVFQLYSATILISLLLTTASLIMDAIMKYQDLERSMESFRILIPSIMFTGMYLFIRIRIRAVGRLLSLMHSFTWEDLPTRDPETGSLTMATWIPHIESFVRRLTIFANIYFQTDVLFRKFTIANTELPYKSWYPFNTSFSPVYELIFISQVFASGVGSFFGFGFNGLYATVVSVTCAQLEKLRCDLLEIGKVVTQPTDSFEDTQLHTCENQMKLLNDCVQRHQNILSFISEMEDAFNSLMVGIFIMQLASMCLSAFSIVTSWGRFGEVLQGVIVYVSMLMLQANYCWFASQLSFQAEKIREAAYGCNWVGAPIPFQRNIIMIITRANLEFNFSAGKFVPVNIKTLVNMVNQSVSYFMFLLELTKKIESDEEIAND